MLTDEELTTRLSAALHESVPELTYAGPVPRVHRGGRGLVATSALAAAAALAFTPAALQRGDGRPPGPVPGAGSSTHPSSPAGRTGGHAVEIPGLHLSFASDDDDPGPIYYYVDPDATLASLPDDAEKLDLGLPYDVWYVDDPAPDKPQIYIGHHACPDTVGGCDGGPPQFELYGILAPGWTREQLIYLVTHPLYDQQSRDGVLRPHG